MGKSGATNYTFSVGLIFGNPPIYEWRKEAGDALMKGGFDNFRNLYNNKQNPIFWDIRQLKNEQSLLQPIHEKYMEDYSAYRWISNLITDSDGTFGELLQQSGLVKTNQQQLGGIDILDKASRIRYGCQLLGYTAAQGCKP